MISLGNGSNARSWYLYTLRSTWVSALVLVASQYKITTKTSRMKFSSANFHLDESRTIHVRSPIDVACLSCSYLLLILSLNISTRRQMRVTTTITTSESNKSNVRLLSIYLASKTRRTSRRKAGRHE